MTLKPEFALEIFTNIKDNFPKPLIDYWGGDIICNPVQWLLKAQDVALKVGAKYLCLAFNIDENDNEIKNSIELFLKLQDIVSMPLIIRGSGLKDFDAKFLPCLINQIKKPAIVAFAQDLNYKPIVSAVLNSSISSDLKLVLRAPIDINLSKELNILCVDYGLNPQNIIMDTDTGCVGMGLDYGYSIIERIKQAALTDVSLKHPVIVFAGEESFKAKEAKSDDFKDTRGSLKVRSFSIETATATALAMAGADIIVCENPLTIEALSSLFIEKAATL